MKPHGCLQRRLPFHILLIFLLPCVFLRCGRCCGRGGRGCARGVDCAGSSTRRQRGVARGGCRLLSGGVGRRRAGLGSLGALCADCEQLFLRIQDPVVTRLPHAHQVDGIEPSLRPIVQLCMHWKSEGTHGRGCT